MAILKELYFTIFVVFFRLSRWSGAMKIRTAYFGVVFVEAAAFLSILFWVAAIFREPMMLNIWFLIAVSLVLSSATDRALINGDKAAKFIGKFEKFSYQKRIFLFTLAVTLIVLTLLVFYFSALHYRATVF